MTDPRARSSPARGITPSVAGLLVLVVLADTAATDDAGAGVVLPATGGGAALPGAAALLSAGVLAGVVGLGRPARWR